MDRPGSTRVGHPSSTPAGDAAPWRRAGVFFDAALDAILIADDAGRVVDANRAACALFGYSHAELTTAAVSDLVPAVSRGEFEQCWASFLGGGWSRSEAAMHTHDGSGLVVELRAVAGLVPGLHMICVRDVTERKKADAELRQQKQLLQLIVDHIPVMLNFIDMDGHIRWINREWQNVLGWSMEEVLSLEIYREAFPDPAERDLALSTLRSRASGWRDARIRNKHGEYIDSSWAMVHLADGTAIGIGQDIRERKRVEEELRASREQLRRLSARVNDAIERERTDLARELHDQLGQSLTALKLDLAWLHKQPPIVGREAKALRDKIATMSTAIDETIRQIRRISAGLRPVALERLGLLATIEWQTEQFERLTGVRCRFTSHVDKLTLPSDHAMQVYRILQEALTNTTRHANASRVSIVARVRQRRFVLEVRDNGRGISEEALADRTALGLLGMRERALLAGGELTIARAGRKGTVVIVAVPLAASS